MYRKNEPALYCPTCRTSVAQAELDDVEKPSVFYDIAFDLMMILKPNLKKLLLPPRARKCWAHALQFSIIRTIYAFKHLKGKFAKTPLFNFQVPLLADEKVNPEKGTGLVMCCTFGDKTDVEWYKKHKPFLLPILRSLIAMGA